MNDIVIIGAGGHAKVIKDIINDNNYYNILGVIDANLKKGELWQSNIYCLGNDLDLCNIYKSGIENIVIGIGNNLALRTKIYKNIKKIGFNLPIIAHKSAFISKTSIIDEGTVIMPLAIINSYAKIGKYAIINSGAIVEHDCNIEDNVHIAPGACILGGVKVGNNTHIGAKAVIIQSLEIGANTVVGAGAVVTKNILNNKKVMGVPAK
ncbi:hypothetical protein AN641_00275 [Candidatus Epulonipiscioides gigas]|nr:hypothetical protein AN641_00275 [Epulopiscium sp. SCG-C07WGA-EpuloA2]